MTNWRVAVRLIYLLYEIIQHHSSALRLTPPPRNIIVGVRFVTHPQSTDSRDTAQSTRLQNLLGSHGVMIETFVMTDE